MIDQHRDRSATSTKIIAEVPLAETFGYSTDLRSMTQGQGTFTMEFAKYRPRAGEHPDRNHRRAQGRAAAGLVSKKPRGRCPAAFFHLLADCVSREP